MSASPMARQASRSIPVKKTYLDETDLPSHYSSTPGGTLYSMTPGEKDRKKGYYFGKSGNFESTKIVYEKQFLLNLRNSPISKTPPNYGIPDALLKGKHTNHYSNPNKRSAGRNHIIGRMEDEDQFHMDM